MHSTLSFAAYFDDSARMMATVLLHVRLHAVHPLFSEVHASTLVDVSFTHASTTQHSLYISMHIKAADHSPRMDQHPLYLVTQRGANGVEQSFF
jgi:hypothetical protein